MRSITMRYSRSQVTLLSVLLAAAILLLVAGSAEAVSSDHEFAKANRQPRLLAAPGGGRRGLRGDLSVSALLQSFCKEQ